MDLASHLAVDFASPVIVDLAWHVVADLALLGVRRDRFNIAHGGMI